MRIAELIVCFSANIGLLYFIRRRRYFDIYMARGILPCIRGLDKVMNIVIWCVHVAVLAIMLASEKDVYIKYVCVLLAVWLFYIALIDAQNRTIPNVLLGSLAGMRAVWWGLEIVLGGMPEKGQLLYQFLYTFILFLLLLFVAMISKGGFGYGDVKMLTVMSLFLNYGMLMSAILTALLAAMVCSLYLLTVKKTDRKSAIPFAPFFYCGFVLNGIIMLWN